MFGSLERAHTAYLIERCLGSAIDAGRVLAAPKAYNPASYDTAPTDAANDKGADNERKARVLDVLLGHGFKADLTSLTEDEVRLLARTAVLKYRNLGTRLQAEKKWAGVVCEELL